MKIAKTFAASLIALSLGAGSAYSNENCDIDLFDTEIAKLALQIDAKNQQGTATVQAAVDVANATVFTGSSDQIECSKRDFVFGQVELALSQLQ